jgi:anti-sigma factor RsiW
MNCPNLRHHLSAYLDDETPPELCREVEAHLRVCAACQAELAGLRRLDRALATLPAPDPPDLAPRVLARVRPPARPWWRSVSLAASLVLGLVLGAALAGNFYPYSLYQANGNGDVLALEEILRDFPQDSLGRAVISYQDEEENSA